MLNKVLLLGATVLGLNAANVPANIGDALSTVGATGEQIVSSAGSLVGQTGGLNIDGIAQASMGSSVKPIFVSGKNLGNLGNVKPINVSKVRLSKKKTGGFGQGLGSLTF